MLPALAASFLCFLAACFDFPTEFSKGWDASGLPDADLISKKYQIYTPDSVNFLDWIKDAAFLIDPFRFGEVQFPRYDYPLWTMPVEYMGSMVVYIVVVGTSLVRQTVRNLILAFMVCYCFWSARWQWCIFIGGVLIAHLAYISPSSKPDSYLPLAQQMDEDDSSTSDRADDFEKLPSTSSSTLATFLNLETYTTRLKPLAPYFSLVWHIFSTLIFLFALHVGSFPDGPPSATATAFGFGYLSKLVPLSWGYFSGYCLPDVAALILVFILSKAEFLQKIFTTRIAQYLGDISLSIYMLHVLVLTTLGNWLIIKCLIFTRGLGGWGFPVGMTIALSCCGIVTVWISDIFCRLVDKRCIQFASWVSKKASVKE